MFAAPVFFGLTLPVQAHPHVWATVRSEVMFGPDETVTGIRQAWTFDEFYSAMAVQGLDKNGDKTYTREELQELAQVNVESLHEFDFFTFVREEGTNDFLPLNNPKDYWVEYDGTALTLHFTLPLQTPLDVSAGPVTIDVYDPTFFVAFGFAERSPVQMAGAPSNCTAKVDIPDAEMAADAKALTESFFTQLGPNSNYGSQFAQTVTVTCATP